MVALPLMCVHYSVQQFVSKVICGATRYSNMWCYSVQQYVVLLGTAICLMLATSAPPDVCDATDGGDMFTMHYLGTAMHSATMWCYSVQQCVVLLGTAICGATRYSNMWCYSVQQFVSKVICGATRYSNMWCYSVQQYVVLLGTAICGATRYSNMWCYSVQQYVVLLGTAICGATRYSNTCLMLATSAPPDVCDATDGGDMFNLL